MSDRELEAHDDRLATDVARRFLDTLERLLALPSADLNRTLSDAADLVAQATGADKVDAFLYDPRRDSLVAVGSSNQPLSVRQRQLGLDVLPVSNGGRVVYVYQTGRTFVTGRLEDDPEELCAVKEGLQIRSKVGAPLVVGGTRRGMIMLASLKPDYFTEVDVRFAESIARRQCVENLLANAIQKSPRDASVDVVIRSEIRETGEWAVVDVIDQGPGVPEHLLPHIFNRYVSGTAREGGLGLGLYLARQIAVMHGGDLNVESSPGRGARFSLTIPCLGDR